MWLDSYGIDPLSDGMWDQMEASGIWHTVTEAEAGNPQVLAYTYYKDVNWYEYILAWNKLPHPSMLVAGLTIEVPKIVPVSQAPITISI